jgi:hypothetical protein
MKTSVKIKIIQDQFAESPRKWDNLGIIACWHRRYNLGNKDGPEKLLEAVKNHKRYSESWEDPNSDNYKWIDTPSGLIDAAESLGIIMLPLYLYDHSGLTMNTTGFSCPWDSGQVGVIFVTREKVRKEFLVERISSKLLGIVKERLKSEVEVYDQYLKGDVYGYDISEVDEDGEEIRHIDSCWGFYGDDPEKNGMKDHWPKEYHNIEPEYKWK